APPPPAAPAAPRPSGSVQVTSYPTDTTEIDKLFRKMVELKSSDLHLKAGKIPIIRVDGGIKDIPGLSPLSSNQIEMMVHSIMPERNQIEYRETNDTD